MTVHCFTSTTLPRCYAAMPNHHCASPRWPPRTLFWQPYGAAMHTTRTAEYVLGSAVFDYYVACLMSMVIHRTQPGRHRKCAERRSTDVLRGR